jgi:prophage regulatory protein
MLSPPSIPAEDRLSTLPNSALLRLKTLEEWHLLPVSRATLWRKVRAGTFPQPVRVGPNIVAWRAFEIRQWLMNPNNFARGCKK